jgi:hypothetical protein
MTLLPPLQQSGSGISRWRLGGTLHQACAQAEGGSIVFLGSTHLIAE